MHTMQCRWRTAPLVLRLFARRTHISHGSAHTPNSLLSRPPPTTTTTPTPVTSSAVTLRPYQEACIDACTAALASGSTTRIGVSLPTGAGKTTVFISLLARIQPPAHSPQATRALIVVNTIELARQSAAQVARMFPEWTVEIEQGTQYRASGLADVTVATYQTLSKEARLKKFDRSMLKAIIVDEAHHAASPSYRRLLAQFNSGISHADAAKLEPPHDRVPIIGFSATFRRHDGLALNSVFETIAYHRDFLDMIKEEWLCEVRFTSVKAELDLQDVSTNGAMGDFVISSLAKIVNTPEINSLIVRAWADRAADRKSTLVFCVDIEHVKALTRTFRAFGVDARYLYSETPPAERKQLIAAFKKGEFPVLINCAILTEGADIPNIDCVVLARPTRSRNLFAQMIGRGMRLSPETGKTDCRIIDFVDNNNRVAGAISVPTIFGLDPRFIDAAKQMDIEDETPQTLIDRISAIQEAVEAEKPAKPAPKPVSVIYEDFDNAVDFEESQYRSDSSVIDSVFAWTHCGDNKFVLDTMFKGFIRVEPTGQGGTFSAAYVASLPGSANAFARPVWIIPPENNATLQQVCEASDAFVRTVLVPARKMQLRLYASASWRKTPASDAQKSFIRSRWLRDEYLSTKVDAITNMTKGDAYTEATRIKHGYIGRAKAKVRRQSTAARKEAEKEARHAAAQAQWKVEVGPLQ